MMTLEEKKRQLEKMEREVDYFEFYALAKKYGFLYPGKEKRSKSSKFCWKCAPRYHQVEFRPSKDILLKEIESLGYCGTGRKYGVTDNAIRKWIKKES